MKPVLIFRHIDFEGPGYLGIFLEKQQIPYEIIAVDAGDSIIHEPGEAAGLVFMGGPMSVNDGLDWIQEEIQLIRQAHILRIPVLGHCLGGQLISRALGAEVYRNPVREIGWHEVEVTNTLAARHWLAGLPPRLTVYHWHSETFELPDGAIPLLTSRNCLNQGYICSNSLALQCHIEMQADMIPVWIDNYRDEIGRISDTVQSAEAMQADLYSRIAELHRVADTVYSRWIGLLKQ